MKTVTMPKDERDDLTIRLKPLDLRHLPQGHLAHRGGKGSHQDRRLKRLRTRATQKAFAFGE